MNLKASPLIACFAAVALHAGGPEDLLAALERLKGQTPLKARVECRLTERGPSAPGRPEESSASLSLGLEEQGSELILRWSRPDLLRADQEAQAQDQDHALATPTRDAMKDLDPDRASHLLNQATVLSGLVRSSAFTGERTDSFEGAPARVLSFTFEPRFTPAQRRSLIRHHGELRVWIAADGTPLSSEQRVDYEGRANRFFGYYKGGSSLSTRYRTEAGRLVVKSRRAEDFRDGSDGSSRTVKELQVSLP